MKIYNNNLAYIIKHKKFMKKEGFVCPKCGHKELETLTEIKSHLDFIGAVCLKCGYIITGNDIKELINKTKDEIFKSFREFILKQKH
jgi:transcription elongation factor Elf1